MPKVITLTDFEISVLSSVMRKLEITKDAVPVKSLRESKKIELLRKYQHIMPDFIAIAKLGKAEGIYSLKSSDSDIARPLQNLAIKEGLYNPEN